MIEKNVKYMERTFIVEAEAGDPWRGCVALTSHKGTTALGVASQGVRWVSEGCHEGVMRVSEGCQKGVRRVSEACRKGVRGCQKGVGRVSIDLDVASNLFHRHSAFPHCNEKGVESRL